MEKIFKFLVHYIAKQPVVFFWVTVSPTSGRGGRTQYLPLPAEVGGLIGTATLSKNGLMPAFRAMSTQYSTGQVVKYNLPASVGFSMCITAIKNHESNGQAVVILTGYQGGIVADAIRKGSYLQGISYVTNSDSIDIYVKVSVYVFVSAVCLGSSNGKFINSSSLVNEVPSDAINVPIS